MNVEKLIHKTSDLSSAIHHKTRREMGEKEAARVSNPTKDVTEKKDGQSAGWTLGKFMLAPNSLSRVSSSC